jgi:hypothetical protein
MPAKPLLYWIAVAVVAVAGILLRVLPSSPYRTAGFDEVLYRGYALKLEIAGLSEYDVITTAYLERQRDPRTMAELPPTRFLYILCGWAWKQVQFGGAPALAGDEVLKPEGPWRDPMLISLRHVSALFTVLLFFTAGAAAYRMGGARVGLAVLALTAVSPLLIHMSQHALIDGFFTFWATLALWSLWECLRHPSSRGWLAVYGLALGAMVLTKENAFFVYVALLAILAVNFWRRFGEARPALLIVTVAAPAVAMLILVLLAGGPSAFIETYKLLVTKAQVLEYAILTGDGPWHRYLIDLLALSPLVLILALGAVFSLMTPREKGDRELATAALYLLTFIVASYAIMILPKHGMNLRYATIWDFPLRFLAVAQLVWLTSRWPARQTIALAVAVVILCGYDCWQYRTCFVKQPLYELATPELLHVLDIAK